MIKGFKGFNKDLKCRDFQYQIGQTYETIEKPVRCTSNGFHLCEDPLDTFNYYAPNTSRYCKVEGDGEVDRKSGGDSKVAVSKISIGAEIGLHGLIQAAVKFRFEKVDWSNAEQTATGYRGAASATGYRGAASATGDQGAASATGYRGAASATGTEGVAMSIGYEGKAKAALDSCIVLAEWEDRDDGWHRKDVQCALVDGVTIKADTWYQLQDGEFVEVEN